MSYSPTRGVALQTSPQQPTWTGGDACPTEAGAPRPPDIMMSRRGAAPAGPNSMNAAETEKRFDKGIEEFNTRRFFEAHETWEEIWLSAQGPEKTFLQGIIQIAAGFHHYVQGNRAGAQSLMASGVVKLIPFPPNHRGLNIEALRTAGKNWVATLGAGKDPGLGAIPLLKR